MPTIITDSFTDTVGVALTAHTGESGVTWTRTTATGAVSAPIVDSTGGRFRGTNAASSILYSNTVATVDGEYTEMVVDNLSNTGTYGVGVRCNATSGYYLVVGGGLARMLSMSGGTLTPRTSQARTHVVGQHIIKIQATGTGASVNVRTWFDGVELTAYTDSTGTRVTTLAGAGILLGGADSDSTGNHIVSITAEEPVPGAGLVMTWSSPVAGYVFPRLPMYTGTSGTISAIYGYTGGVPATIEARIVTSPGGSALSGFDWSTKVPTPSGGGGTMTFTSVPNGGPYYLQMRDSATPATVIEVGPMSVGARFAIIGQSPALKAFRTGDSTLTPDSALRVTGNIGSWIAADTATMNGAIAFGNDMITALGCPVALLDYAVDGSGLIVVSNGARWVPSGSNAYVAFKAGVDLIGGQIEGVVWAQGEGDAIQAVSQTDYYNGLTTLFSTIRTDLAQPTLPIVLVTLGRRLDGTLPDANSEAIKTAQALKCLDANVYRVDRMDLAVSGDNIHQTASGFTTIYQRASEAMKAAYGLVSQYRGPSITSVVPVTATTFDVNLTHRSGTDFTPTTGITGFSATDPGASNAVIAVTAAVRQSANVIRITLASTPVSLPVIRYLYGTNPTVTSAVKGNDSLARPLEYAAGILAAALSVATGTTVDAQVLKLRALGRTGALNDMINENVYWRALAGGSTLPLNDVKKNVLRGLGYTGALPDMEKAYWQA